VKPRGPDKFKRKRRTDEVKAGPGRPQGSTNALPRGAVGALKALRHRVPEGIPEPLAEIADEAFDVVVSCMRGDVSSELTGRLSASKYVREEICGPIAQKLEVNLGKGLAERIKKGRERVAAR